jgi:F-type H+-transporting ATPase subunit b
MKKFGLVLMLLLVLGSAGVRAQENGHAKPRDEHAPKQRTDAGGRDTTPAAQSPLADATEKDENEVYRQSAVVAKLGHMMGMSTTAAASSFEIFNFLVLAVALGWVVSKTLPKALRDRSTGIQKDLADARSATEEASVRLNSVEERLSKLDAQIAEMRANAEKDASAEEKRLRDSAEAEKQKILASAEQEIASATQAARRDLQQYAAGLAIEQAARRLVISAETDRVLVKNFAQRLGEGSGHKGGEN